MPNPRSRAGLKRADDRARGCDTTPANRHDLADLPRASACPLCGHRSDATSRYCSSCGRRWDSKRVFRRPLVREPMRRAHHAPAAVEPDRHAHGDELRRTNPFAEALAMSPLDGLDIDEMVVRPCPTEPAPMPTDESWDVDPGGRFELPQVRRASPARRIAAQRPHAYGVVGRRTLSPAPASPRVFGYVERPLRSTPRELDWVSEPHALAYPHDQQWEPDAASAYAGAHVGPTAITPRDDDAFDEAAWDAVAAASGRGADEAAGRSPAAAQDVDDAPFGAAGWTDRLRVGAAVGAGFVVGVLLMAAI